MKTPFAQRRQSLLAELAQSKLDHLLVAKPANLYYLTGFTGDAGALVVSRAGVSLITDGRFITQAREVPLAFRQRQYQRFRSLLVEHLANLLDHGVSIETVMPGLTQVITGLGVASFEADYIRGEAESRLSQQTTQVPDFAQRLREAQNAYRTRMRTLEAMNELDEDSREQLLEQEKLKFQAQLRAISGEGDGS